MSTLKSLVCAGLVGTGVVAAAPEQADAGGFQFSIGVSRPYYGGYGWYGGGYPSYYGRHYGYGHGHSVWHDTSHWDYYPGRLVPHGDHYDYIPGHRVWHNDGHWDHYGHGHYGHWH